MFCLKVGLSYLVKEFGSCDISRTPSKKERKVIDSLSSILRDAVYDNLIIDCEEESRVEEDERDPKWIADDEDTPARKGNGSVRFGDVEISEEKVKETIEYYRSTNKNSRPLSSMRSRSRSIESKHHLEKLRRLEKESGGKLERSHAAQTSDISLRDSDIRQMALKTDKDESLLENFKASYRWIQEFIAVYLQAHHFFDCAQISVVVNQCLIYGPKLWEIFVTSEKLW
ncbi:hypothetical protein Y032_0005g2290 [Ancylostoma ceylanicum]|uniref:Uncharacterized protein n=1 Tax=Ancylostoma ceylanicum TaxID=53326 RepID=A0A016VQZ8_9BILA|nr:hypothetical protein Y032_0005g2290 [Ancylostoma ceylanicum]